MILDLIYNLSVLVALSIFSGFVDNRFERKTATGQVIQGMLFGITAIVGMMYPFVFSEGIIFDGRSIVISISAFFFGPLTGAISSVMAIIYRIYLGGGGALTGSLVIAASYFTGVAFFWYIKRKKENLITYNHLLLLGLSVHVLMLLLMVSLPSGAIMKTLEAITITVLGAFPAATIITGTILLEHRRNQITLQQLKVSEARFRRITEHAVDLIFRYEFLPERKFGFVSNGVTEMTGYTPEDHYADPDLMYKIFYHEDLDYFKEASLKGELFGKPAEFRWVRKSGEVIWVEQRVSPVMNDEGNVIAVEGIVRDITQRKKTLQIWLENERLSTIGQTASAIAHDFNNSLQAIYSNIELLLTNENVSLKTKKHLESIQQIAEDAAERVKTLQRFGAEARLPEIYTALNLEKLLNEVLLQARPLWKDEAEKKGLKIDIAVNIHAGLFVRGNLSSLRAVFYNLVKNSVEAMENGGNIRIKAEQKGEMVNIFVSDTGKGMTKEVAERAFMPFFTTKGFDVGRGVGLSSVYRVLKDHGGDIKILETAPGQGTTFEVQIPHEVEAAVEVQEISNKINNKRIRVLWVDDDRNIRELAAEMLESLGVEGILAASGEEALDILARESFEAVITDIGMPHMNGWQLADKIYTEYNGSLPVVVLSGWGTEITDEKLKQHHVKMVLPKPFRITHLKSFIESAIDSEG